MVLRSDLCLFLCSILKKLMKLLPRIALILSLPIMAMAQNPFLDGKESIYGTFPFGVLKNEHYEPAFRQAITLQNEEIRQIVENTEPPTFENTIEALEKSGALLSTVANVFFNLNSAESNDEMMEIAQQVMPLLSSHQNNIVLNAPLFDRVKKVYAVKDAIKLTAEQQQLLKKSYLSFANNGANLNAEQKEEYRALSEKLSQLTLNFGQNVLIETNKYEMLIEDEADLKGLPADFIASAKAKAEEKEKAGWLIDLSAPSYISFMKYAENRSLRQELYRAYGSRAFHTGDNGNKEIVKEIVNTRIRLAQLLGHINYATYELQEKMAKTPENVYNLLNNLSAAYSATAKAEVDEAEAFARKSEGEEFKIMPWDWSFYSEKLKSEKFNIDDNILKPYFELESVKKGVFGLATKLYGITFTKNNSIEAYHPDVEAYEVRGANGELCAVLYVDFHPRAGKRPGAWMTEFKAQSRREGKRVIPQISIVMNFTPAMGDTPSLLTFDELETLLHEFGHALHGMLSDVTYESLAGTNVYQDFVELPSQILENWATEKEFLDQFAVHYQTKEKIDSKIIKKMVEAANFNTGYACLRQLSFGFLDMAWHTLQTPFDGEIDRFEQSAMETVKLLPVIDGTCMSSAFNHIFAGGYAAGYYGYKWAEVLDADAFSLFKQNGIFDPATAKSFLDNILSKGGSEEPMTLYVRFRGTEPSIDALLKRNGVKK